MSFSFYKKRANYNFNLLCFQIYSKFRKEPGLTVFLGSLKSRKISEFSKKKLRIVF